MIRRWAFRAKPGKILASHWLKSREGIHDDHSTYAQQAALFTSLPLLAELRGVICRDKFANPPATRGLDARDIFDGYVALCRLIEPAALKRIVLTDPDDDHVLACAIGAKADIIVSGDRDLLGLGGE